MRHLVIITAALLAAMPVDGRQTGDEPTLALEDCRIRAGRGFPGIKARCGLLMRHEDPANANSPLLELFVAVVPALTLEPEPDPFVPIAGGPGQASSEFYAAYRAAFEMVRRNRDIILLDQRGTGQSAAMNCEEDEEILEGRFSREQTIVDTRACLDQLPHDPRFFTTSVAVRDLEALRKALGYTKFNLYGISYGSRVAQHFARRYPESTRTVILDGVVPPQLALGPGIAIEAQNALDAIFDRCAESEDCAQAFPDLREDFGELRDALENEPVTITLPNPVSGRPEEMRFGRPEMAAALRLLSYHPNSVAIMPLLIDQAIEGNYAPLAAQFMMISDSMADAMSLGMHNAVVCTEDAPYFAGENVGRDALDATYIGPVQLDALEAICSVWPAGLIDDQFKRPLASDVPVLLLSGEADPVTPPRYAELAAIDLGNARLLIGHKQGHGQAPRGCMPDVIAEFVETANPQALETDCLERLFAMPFFLDFSGPSE
ncbi:MAG: alpha/beta fold hydrolase [Proteobacteria bacterium]|nr:alpha/beta fold hydrolase [Pseudomonadota bacterium]